ncbi:COP9 signalosome complex subunit 3 [Coemansia sp. RSA 552]|nr:COP9 signalosome complex subunit 3 [Coemansia sp. RSA 552]
MVAEKMAEYERLITTAQQTRVGTEGFQRELVAGLRQWHRPAGQFSSDLLSRALGALGVGAGVLASVQILADALELASTNEQVQQALAAVQRLGTVSDEEVAALVAFPEMLQRLVGGLARAGRADAARAADTCLGLVDRVDKYLRTTRGAELVRSGRGAMERLGSRGGVRLTPLHVECMRACVLARRRALSERAAARAAMGFDSIGFLVVGERLRAFLEYHLYAGMVWASLGDLAQAERMWYLCFALPSKHISAIQVAAYKRLVLAALGARGERARLPAFFAASHTRAIEGLAPGYVALAELATAGRSLAPLVAKLRDLRLTLERDGNWGLAMHVLDAVPAHFVRRVGRAYSCLPICRLASLTDFAEHPLAQDRGTDAAQALVAYIAQMGDPSVEVAGTPQVVRFAYSPLHSEAQCAASLAARVQEVEALSQRLGQMDRHLALTKEYIVNSHDQSTAA